MLFYTIYTQHTAHRHNNNKALPSLCGPSLSNSTQQSKALSTQPLTQRPLAPSPLYLRGRLASRPACRQDSTMQQLYRITGNVFDGRHVTWVAPPHETDRYHAVWRRSPRRTSALPRWRVWVNCPATCPSKTEWRVDKDVSFKSQRAAARRTSYDRGRVMEGIGDRKDGGARVPMSEGRDGGKVRRRGSVRHERRQGVGRGHVTGRWSVPSVGRLSELVKVGSEAQRNETSHNCRSIRAVINVTSCAIDAVDSNQTPRTASSSLLAAVARRQPTALSRNSWIARRRLLHLAFSSCCIISVW